MKIIKRFVCNILLGFILLNSIPVFAITPRQLRIMRSTIKNWNKVLLEERCMYEHMIGVVEKKDEEIRILKEFIELVAHYGRVVLYLLPPGIYMLYGLLGK
jgi:hypothetical protein